MPGKFHEVMLFSKCTGLNDSSETSAAKYDADGNTDVVGCLNLTTTPEGKLVKVPTLNHKLTTLYSIDELSAGSRMLVQLNNVVGEFNGSVVSALTQSPVCTPGVKASYIHTPLDVRIRASVGSTHKLANGSAVCNPTALGTYGGPATSEQLVGMPDFTGGFVYNAKLFTVLGKFLQYSKDYHYDVWSIAGGHIGSQYTVLQAGQIPGCLITTHSNGITVYTGVVGNFVKKFYPCAVLAGTLYSGFVSKAYENAHVFLCADGVYIVTPDGKLSNLTVENTDALDTLNTTYNTVLLRNGKYLAYGNSLCVEFDFITKALLLRSTLGVTASCFWGGKHYVASGNNLYTLGDSQTDEAMVCSVTLPYNNFNLPFTKQLRFLYFTGKGNGPLTVTVRNQYGDVSAKTYQLNGYVQNKKLDGLRLCKGPKLSVELSCTTGEFKLEELRAAFVTCSNYN